MKVLILSTEEFGIAPNRLYKAIQKKGIEVKMLVRDKISDDINAFSINNSWITKKINYLRFVWERIIILINNHFNRKELFKVSIANTGTDISSHPLVKKADIIHLHWINQGFLSLKDIQSLINTGKPIVWTMHDMWLCTGICHHSWDCKKFMHKCGNCKFLHSQKEKDLSYRIFMLKQILLSKSGINIVTVSSWLKDMAQKSAITGNLKISVIPNVIDLNIFHPTDKNSARRELNIPYDKKIVLMGANNISDPIKGFYLLKEAVNMIYNTDKNILLVIFGDIKDHSTIQNSPFPIKQMGLIKDSSKIMQLYAASDVNVVPSYYETFGQTIIEAMACGCPSVTFNNSGQTDIIEHKVDGYLAEYRNVEDLANGIKWVWTQKRSKISELCIEKVHNNYAEDIVAKQYIDLYKRLLKQ